MSLEVINAQGAQVKQLEQMVQERELIIALLTGGKPANLRFPVKKQQEIADNIAVNWRQNKDGTIVINIGRKESN
jgi:hypothetical protein